MYIETATVTVFPYLRQIASRFVTTRLHWLHLSRKSQKLEFLLFAVPHIATGDSPVSTVLSSCSMSVLYRLTVQEFSTPVFYCLYKRGQNLNNVRNGADLSPYTHVTSQRGCARHQSTRLGAACGRRSQSNEELSRVVFGRCRAHMSVYGVLSLLWVSALFLRPHSVSWDSALRPYDPRPFQFLIWLVTVPYSVTC
jgi:hypothetical protein